MLLRNWKQSCTKVLQTFISRNQEENLFLFNSKVGKLDSVKDSDISMITSLQELSSETRTEGLLAKYVACFGIFLDFWTEKHDSETGIIENLRAGKNQYFAFLLLSIHFR